MGSVANAVHREPWNKGEIVGQKAPFKLKDSFMNREACQALFAKAGKRPTPEVRAERINVRKPTAPGLTTLRKTAGVTGAQVRAPQ